MNIHIKNHQVLFWFGVLGIVFYMVAPLIFPHAQGLRQPELLPVFTLMLGLGQLLKGNTITISGKGKSDEDTKLGRDLLEHGQEVDITDVNIPDKH